MKFSQTTSHLDSIKHSKVVQTSTSILFPLMAVNSLSSLSTESASPCIHQKYFQVKRRKLGTILEIRWRRSIRGRVPISWTHRIPRSTTCIQPMRQHSQRFRAPRSRRLNRANSQISSSPSKPTPVIFSKMVSIKHHQWQIQLRKRTWDSRKRLKSLPVINLYPRSPIL